MSLALLFENSQLEEIVLNSFEKWKLSNESQHPSAPPAEAGSTQVKNKVDQDKVVNEPKQVNIMRMFISVSPDKSVVQLSLIIKFNQWPKIIRTATF